MKLRILILSTLCVFSVAGCVSVPQERLSLAIEKQELSDHVHFLAQPSLKGRQAKTWESATVRQYLKDRFEAYGLVPWPGTKAYEQPFGFGTNVIGVLPGSDPDLANEIVILAAHYDHLGKRKKGIYHGASDNASGVAALLEIAEYFSLSTNRPKRSICFASFDAEESMCLGSFAFTCREDYDDSKVSAVVNIDLLGRDFLDVVDSSMCVVGTDGYPDLQRQIINTGEKEGIKVLPFHSELIGPVGDHIAFISKERPVFFFSSGLHRDYHKPTDTADKLNYNRMNSSILIVSKTLSELANSEEIETRKQNHFKNIELESTVYLFDKVIEKHEVLDINDIDMEKFKEISDDLKRSLEKNMTKSEQVAKERDAIGELLNSLHNYDKSLAITGKSFISISEFYALDPEGLANSYRGMLKSILENRFSILFGINYEYESGKKITDEDWALTQTRDGQHFLAIIYTNTHLEAKKGFLKSCFSFEARSSMHFGNCKGSKEDIIDYCVMRIKGINIPATAKMPELAVSLKETYIKIFNNLTNEYHGLSLEEITDKHYQRKGFSSYDDWLNSLVDSNNPELAKGAIGFSSLSSGKIVDKFLTIIQNENIRADIRGEVIYKLAGQKKVCVLMAVSGLLDDETLMMKKNYDLEYDEEFPLAKHSYMLYFRKGMGNWYDTEGKKYTIAKVAHNTLKEITGKDFGKDKKAWQKWIRAKYE